MHITTSINKTQNEARSYIFIRKPERFYFPIPGKNFKIIDSINDELYAVHLENSYRIPGLKGFFISHPVIEKGTKIHIEVLENKTLYKIYVDHIPSDIDQTVNLDLEAIAAEDCVEGGMSSKFVNYFERNPKLRAAAIQIHGTTCMACQFNFAKKYGDRGEDFIEVHHLKPVSGNLDRIQVNPHTDLVVVCSNCHRMIHRRKSNILSLQDLRKLIRSQT